MPPSNTSLLSLHLVDFSISKPQLHVLYMLKWQRNESQQSNTSNSLNSPDHVHPSLQQCTGSVDISRRMALSGNVCAVHKHICYSHVHILYRYSVKTMNTSSSAVAHKPRCRVWQFGTKYKWKMTFCIKSCQCHRTRSIYFSHAIQTAACLCCELVS